MNGEDGDSEPLAIVVSGSRSLHLTSGELQEAESSQFQQLLLCEMRKEAHRSISITSRPPPLPQVRPPHAAIVAVCIGQCTHIEGGHTVP